LEEIAEISGIDLPVAGGSLITSTTYLEIGLAGQNIEVQPAAKIVLEGMAGSRIGYIDQDGEFVEIMNVCADASAPTDDELITGECKANDGEDLVVWTKHFTKFVVYTEEKVAEPTFNATGYDENGEYFVKVEWEGVGGGVEEYWVLINDTKNIVKASADDLGKKYSTTLKVATFGEYKVIVKSSKSTVTSANIEYRTVNLDEIKKTETVAPVTTPSPTPVEDTTVQEPVTPVAPVRATAAPKAEPEQKIEEANDDRGVIKGEESTEDEEETNWTPWIILFILIVLAGAATGGYFYWFAGEEELPKKPTKGKKVEERKAPAKKSSKAKPKKKYRRW
jgi:nitrite reductase/ring-hydroxylating ferredoxin subunit